jgi:hypothetical protein
LFKDAGAEGTCYPTKTDGVNFNLMVNVVDLNNCTVLAIVFSTIDFDAMPCFESGHVAVDLVIVKHLCNE